MIKKTDYSDRIIKNALFQRSLCEAKSDYSDIYTQERITRMRFFVPQKRTSE